TTPQSVLVVRLEGDFWWSVVIPSRASSLPQDVSVPVRCLCTDGGGNVASSRAESSPAIPCGSELARESGGSVVMPSR
ncbi:hypothetical protein RYA64_28260, partial [Pseudomonas syringae pv. actinidiae]|nr:hypothetical protein [Pseudomonas syringae pv. actinidiae]